MTGENAIAIVGMACRYPGSRNVREYWASLRAGVEGISHFRREDLLARGVDPREADHPDFVPAKGVLDGSRGFDWPYFGYSRAEAAGIDPQQRVFLECAVAAIDDAGLDPTRFPGAVGVFAGADRVPERVGEPLSELAGYIGREKDFLATRVAYKLGLRGPALTVQTACSTSLTAVHLAARALAGHECDAALAGGVAVMGPQDWGYRFERGGILSPDGHCRPFDQDAAGTVPSEGVGVVVLKRLADALRDGDRVAAVLLGSAVNNDGSDKIGYTAPSIPGQAEVVGRAQRAAAVDPADISYVEAHGTATRIGDPVEVQALTDAFRTATDATGFCRLGAVKGNIGHTGAAAGVAGLIKTALMIEHRELVPTVHFKAPNPLLGLESTPFTVCVEHEPWTAPALLAAVSSFGVGGTNAHVVVGEAPAPARARVSANGGPRILALSAATPEALGRMRGNLASYLEAEPAVPLAGVARTLADRRRHPHRQAFVAAEPAEAARLLAAAPRPRPQGPATRVAFLFPGQGTLTHAAGDAAHRLLPVFRKQFDEIRDALRSRHDVDIAPVAYGSATPADWFADTVHQQLGLFALGVSLGRQLSAWGLRPAAMLGNSVGEYAAAVLAGVWTPAVGASLVHARAAAMGACAPGRMAAVDVCATEVARRLGAGSGLSIAVAGPAATVVSGSPEALEAALSSGVFEGCDVRPLNNRRAFHSPAMIPAADALTEAVLAAEATAPRLRLVSNSTGDWADPQAVTRPEYWTRQLCETVRLADGVGTLLASGCDAFVELGPGTSMLGVTRRHADWDPAGATVPMLGRAGDDPDDSLLRALAGLWQLGVDPALAAVGDGEQAWHCSLPAYPFADEDPETARAVPEPARRPAGSVEPAAPTGTARSAVTELWCRTLGVEAAADSDDFFALGGESLSAVGLVNQFTARTGAVLSVSDFTTDATFGRLVRLAEQAGRTGRGGPAKPLRAGAAGAVLLREGTGRPFFLLADATGTALPYRALVAEPADPAADRPIVALEPAPSGPGRRGIPDLAAEHVAAILREQPEGPYTLGGWSFAAVVAHEAAAQLTARGARVDLLVCLDGHVPDTHDRRGGVDPKYWSDGLRLGAGAALGVGPVGRRLRRSPELRRVFVANMYALLRYRPRPVACPVVVFKAGVDRPTAHRLGRRLAPWYGGGARVRVVGGDHWSMLTAPHAADLAEDLREVLAETQGSDIPRTAHERDRGR